MFLKSGNTFHPFGMRYPEQMYSPNTKSQTRNREELFGILKKKTREMGILSDLVIDLEIQHPL